MGGFPHLKNCGLDSGSTTRPIGMHQPRCFASLCTSGSVGFCCTSRWRSVGEHTVQEADAGWAGMHCFGSRPSLPGGKTGTAFTVRQAGTGIRANSDRRWAEVLLTLQAGTQMADSSQGRARIRWVHCHLPKQESAELPTGGIRARLTQDTSSWDTG